MEAMSALICKIFFWFWACICLSQGNVYLLKPNKTNTRKRCETYTCLPPENTCSKSTIKILEKDEQDTWMTSMTSYLLINFNITIFNASYVDFKHVIICCSVKLVQEMSRTKHLSIEDLIKVDFKVPQLLRWSRCPMQ